MIKLSSLTNHRLHLAGKFFVPDFRNKQEELDTHAPQGALKKTNNKWRDKCRSWQIKIKLLTIGLSFFEET